MQKNQVRAKQRSHRPEPGAGGWKRRSEQKFDTAAEPRAEFDRRVLERFAEAMPPTVTLGELPKWIGLSVRTIGALRAAGSRCGRSGYAA